MRTGTEEVAGLGELVLSWLCPEESLIIVYKALHQSLILSVLIPYHTAVRIPLPYVGYDKVFLRAELSRLIHTHLNIRLAVGGAILPTKFLAIHCHHHISVRRNRHGKCLTSTMLRKPNLCCADKDAATPPRSRRSGVSGEDMGIIGEYFLQTLGVKDVVDGFHGVPSRRVHVKDDEAVLLHVAKVALQPAQVFPLLSLFLVVATSAIIDALDGYDGRCLC